MFLSKSLEKRIGLILWWDIKVSNIEYYDIQYAAEQTITIRIVGTYIKLHIIFGLKLLKVYCIWWPYLILNKTCGLSFMSVTLARVMNFNLSFKKALLPRI